MPYIICHIIFYLISKLFRFKFTARYWFVLKRLSVLLSNFTHLHLRNSNYLKFLSLQNIILIWVYGFFLLISNALLEFILRCLLCQIKQYSSFLSLFSTPMTVIYINSYSAVIVLNNVFNRN